MKTKHTPNRLDSELYLSHCCGGTVHLGQALAGCEANWVCDDCGCMCHAIRRDAAPQLLEACRWTRDIILGGDKPENCEWWAQDVVAHLDAAIREVEGD